MNKRHSDIAMGNIPAEIVFKNAKIINVFTHSIEQADIAIEDGVILGVGTYSGKTEIDATDKFVAPGFIDGHIHIESSMLAPAEFSKLVIPFGTTRVIADPHEIANVCGVKGLGFMHRSSKSSPLKVHIMIPSCVPATPFEHTGASIDVEDIYNLHKREGILGLGEVMDYPGVIHGEETILDKIETMSDFIIDGHAPRVTGKELNSYLIHHIKTDHECSTVAEMHEKLSRGMYIHLRQGSATRNVRDLVKGITTYNSHRLMFCTDDKHPEDIMNEGHINYNINIAIEEGIDPITAIEMATINTATCYGLKNVGAIAPGYEADLVVFDKLEEIHPTMVFISGQLVSKENIPMFEVQKYINTNVLNTVKFNKNDIDLSLPLKSNTVKVIGFIKNNVTTKKLIRKISIKDGVYVNNKKDNILKMAVIERHHYTGNVGVGLIEGYGLSNGAIAMTISHDSHNIVVVGDNDKDMMLAIEQLRVVQGGITLVKDGVVLETLPLEIAGLMTSKPVEFIIDKLKKMKEFAWEMGVDRDIDDPFLSLAFMSLPVIPDMKLTDTGYFDVIEFKHTSVEA
jgi:adenine deaminase